MNARVKSLLLSILFTGVILTTLRAQYPGNPLPQFPVAWNSKWITHPDIDKAAFGLVHFRNVVHLETVPEKFIIHVSGDNRYRLYINEQEVCYGPQLGDLRHWRYETIDIAPYLKPGENIFAAEVINWGIERSYGIISFKTGFLLQGNSEREFVANTGGSGWKVYKNEGVLEKPVLWRSGGDIVGGFYAANPTDSIVAKKYPWGWKELNYDDLTWKKPENIFSQPKVTAGLGHGWILQPRTTGIQKNKKVPFARVIRSDVHDAKVGFQFGTKSLTIPAHSKKTLLIDQGYVTLGYPKLILSKGRDTRVKIRYSEALYDPSNKKGNRNELDGKLCKGMTDVYVMDGGIGRVFQPLWFRAFRFIQLEIETKEQPLMIDDYYNVFSASPIPVAASFNTFNQMLPKVWDLCWNTLKICAQDNLMSDAYYEQMQYVGDLRPHLMAYTALTGDMSYFRSAIEQFNNSRLPDGNITSCYPLKATFVHTTYSLIWIDMLHDMMMLEGDRHLLATYTGEIQEVFDYYESLINEKGLVGKSDYPVFIDWYEKGGGSSSVNRDGNSAILTLNYAYTLNKASEIMTWLGFPGKANEYSAKSGSLAATVRSRCYDSNRGIYADDPERTFYDQRANILAVLAGDHTAEEKKALLQKTLDPHTEFDSHANLFYYFYLFEAMEKTGVGDFLTALTPWKEILEAGMTATPEKRVEQNPRSEAHPWTAHPVHFYFSLLAGIQPSSPGFNTVRIAPMPGSLEKIEAKYPTRHGPVIVNLSFSKSGKVTGDIILPDGMTGEFVWKGETLSLKEGSHQISAR
jgi:hypothetical protein